MHHLPDYTLISLPGLGVPDKLWLYHCPAGVNFIINAFFSEDVMATALSLNKAQSQKQLADVIKRYTCI